MNKAIEIYRSQDGSIQLNVKLENDTVWLNRQQMADFLNLDRSALSKELCKMRDEGLISFNKNHFIIYENK